MGPKTLFQVIQVTGAPEFCSCKEPEPARSAREKASFHLRFSSASPGFAFSWVQGLSKAYTSLGFVRVI